MATFANHDDGRKSQSDDESKYESFKRHTLFFQLNGSKSKLSQSGMPVRDTPNRTRSRYMSLNTFTRIRTRARTHHLQRRQSVRVRYGSAAPAIRIDTCVRTDE
eukprot:scaffold654007_cov86-Prasinocladus_malaysianus.AAC.1